MGVVKYKGDDQALMLKNNRYGDKYAKVLSKSLGEMHDISVFQLSGNKISATGAEAILSNISK